MFRSWFRGSFISMLWLLTAASSLAQEVATEALETAPPAPLPETANESCPERYLVLTTGPEIDSALAREIRVDLEVELGRRGMSVCTGTGPDNAPLALVSLREQRGVLSIDLDDRTTQKRVARDMRLSHIPETGRALAVAIAVDELLRASWAELTMGTGRERGSEEPERVPAPPVPEEPQLAPNLTRPRYMLSLSTGYTHGRHDLRSFSTALRGSWFPHRYLWLEAALGGFRTLSREGEAGEVYARGLTSDLTLGTCLVQASFGFVCLGARLGIDWMAFRADSYSALAEARSPHATSLQVGGVGNFGVNLPHNLLLFFQSVWGAGVHAAVATDGEQRLLGSNGFLWTGILGLGVVVR